MATSRITLLFISLKHQSFNHFKRLGPVKSFHSSRPMAMKSEKRSNISLQPEKSPSPRGWPAFLIPAAGLTGFAGFVLFLHFNDERRAIPKEVSSGCSGFLDNSTRIRQHVLSWTSSACRKEIKFERSALPDGPIIGGPFSLINTKGQVVTERSLLGNWVLLYFGYTSSPDVGPAEVQKMAKAVSLLDSKHGIRVQPTFVTIDPQHDTPSQLGAYLKEFDPQILGLTGPVGAIRQMAQEYRVFFRKIDEESDDYLVESSHNMYLLNPEMQVVRCFGLEYNTEQLAESILKNIKKTCE